MLELYPLLKPAHVVLALASGAGFAVRGFWMLSNSPRRHRRWVRVAPHVVDTLLLVTGVTLAVILHLSPVAHPWLGAKLALLLAYIGAGLVALRLGPSRGIRGAAFAVALGCYLLILVSAVTHRPLGVL